ncbi:hypoxia up-regulated protein 1-like [Bolinopsis microptera]|uniref:hypoxia up-regulated protein 1-like n=1 Tax=Bolinopsis microptera TaxID=2820187 RepID=UPI003079BE48
MLLRLLISLALFATVSSTSLISLDLGTEFMKIGIVKPGVPIDIVLNTETKRKTPMTVYIKGDERLFGDTAVTRGEKSPKNAYSNLLDLLGKSIDNPVVTEYKERFPYHTIEADPVRNTVVFRHDDNTFYSVEELLAMQIEFAVLLATKHGEAPVSKVIICVPPFFNQKEREAMLNVAEIAGVQVMQLMTTTSAISLQYAVFRNIKMTEKPMIVLFATVGSQFTTAAVVSYSQVKDKVTKELVNTVQVMGVGYDRGLGSYEMDLRLREHLANKFTEKYPKVKVF